MRERKYVKFRVDMHEDTKFKIIDMKPERDLINYVWTRLVVLAGKVNLEGSLYLSRNIAYTIETLAIEFNRGADQVKLALEVLIELEMIEVSEHNIYSVKNFVKHQNIKIKEKHEVEDKEEDIESKEAQVNENLKIVKHDKKDKEYENKVNQNEVENLRNRKIDNLEIIQKDINKIDNNISNEKINNNLQDNNLILLGEKKKKKSNRKNKKDNIEEENEEDTMVWFSEGEERPLAEGESVVQAWSF